MIENYIKNYLITELNNTIIKTVNQFLLILNELNISSEDNNDLIIIILTLILTYIIYKILKSSLRYFFNFLIFLFKIFLFILILFLILNFYSSRN